MCAEEIALPEMQRFYGTALPKKPCSQCEKSALANLELLREVKWQGFMLALVFAIVAADYFLQYFAKKGAKE